MILRSPEAFGTMVAGYQGMNLLVCLTAIFFTLNLSASNAATSVFEAKPIQKIEPLCADYLGDSDLNKILGPEENSTYQIRRAVAHLLTMPEKGQLARAARFEALVRLIVMRSTANWRCSRARGRKGEILYLSPGGKAVVIDVDGAVYTGVVSTKDFGADKIWQGHLGGKKLKAAKSP